MIAIVCLVCLFACSSIAQAQKPESRVDLSCIGSLELPTHGLLAARAPHSGIVVATIKIGSGGALSKVKLAGDSPILEGEVRVALDNSSFTSRCAGRTLEFVFAFTLEDPPTDSILPPAARFLPPNRFEFVFRRVKPNLDSASPIKRDR